MSDNDDFSDTSTVAHPRLAEPSVGAFVLRVIEGPQAGLRCELDASQPSRMLLGQSPACDVRLGDPHVSRRHLAVEVEGRRLRLLDLGSTNGTYVDGVCVREALLSGGEVVRLGATALSVERSAASQPRPLAVATGFGAVVGASEAMRRLYPRCERLAQSDVPVVIEGETGTGKEQLAEALHQGSPRRGGPYVVFDCTAVAPSLIESALFGHEKGAFTGAVAASKGVFERAHRGTLLIDEIGDLPLPLQAKLLRAIERSQITRVGGDRPIQVDVRVLAATRRDLDREVQAGRFRDDLFHRIAVTRIELPPLRDRRGDVRLLAEHFCKNLGENPALLPPELLRRWDDWAWPGNVRELRNAVARWLALGDLDEPEPQSSRPPPAAAEGPRPQGDSIARLLSRDLPLAEARQLLVEEFETRYVEYTLARHGGNVTRAAAAAGVARRHFHRLKARSDDER